MQVDQARPLAAARRSEFFFNGSRYSLRLNHPSGKQKTLLKERSSR
jgi:hypothetical protein